MVPGKYNMTVFRGGTFDISISATDDNGDINFGQTYTSAKMCIYRAWLNNLDEDLDNCLYELNTTNGMLIITNTVIHIHIPALVTPALPFDSGVYLLKLIVDGIDPIIDPFLKGRITVANGI